MRDEEVAKSAAEIKEEEAKAPKKKVKLIAEVRLEGGSMSFKDASKAEVNRRTSRMLRPRRRRLSSHMRRGAAPRDGACAGAGEDREAAAEAAEQKRLEELENLHMQMDAERDDREAMRTGVTSPAGASFSPCAGRYDATGTGPRARPARARTSNATRRRASPRRRRPSGGGGQRRVRYSRLINTKKYATFRKNMEKHEIQKKVGDRAGDKVEKKGPKLSHLVTDVRRVHVGDDDSVGAM